MLKRKPGASFREEKSSGAAVKGLNLRLVFGVLPFSTGGVVSNVPFPPTFGAAGVCAWELITKEVARTRAERSALAGSLLREVSTKLGAGIDRISFRSCVVIGIEPILRWMENIVEHETDRRNLSLMQCLSQCL